MNKNAEATKSSTPDASHAAQTPIDVEKQLQFAPLWSRAWQIFWQNWIKIIAVGLAAQVATSVLQALAQGPEFMKRMESESASSVIVVALLSFAALALSLQIGNGLVRYYLQIIREKQTDLSVFAQDPIRIISSTIASILMGIIVMVGYLLLIIPGIIWSIKYRYVQWLIIDRKMDLKAAFSTSAAMVEGYKKRIFFLDARFALIVLLPLLIELLIVLAAVMAHDSAASYAWPVTILAVVTGAVYVGYLIVVAGPLFLVHYSIYDTLLTHHLKTSGGQLAHMTGDESDRVPTLQAPPDAA